MESEYDLTRYVRNGLIMIFLSIGWYLIVNQSEKNIWYKLFLVAFVVGIIFFLYIILLKPNLRWRTKKDWKELRIVSWPAWTTIILVILFYSLSIGLIDSGSSRFVILVCWSVLCGYLVASFYPKRNPYMVFMTIVLLGGALYRSGAFVNEISSSEFSLGWSEGSRIYNASLFFSEKLYGQKLPLPVLHPSRYLMQSLPFLFDIDSIFVHRLWQVLLWIGMTGWASWLFAKKVSAGLKVPLFWVSTFCFLFFFQGAVYYHLMVCVILVLIGYRKEKPLRTLLFVLLASLWAGISRINWIPVPALLAVSLYIIDTPFDGKDWFGYLKLPFLWSVVGAAAAFGSKQFYQVISGEAPEIFDSAFSSKLLWSRLLPNATYSLGILPAILVVCLPLLILTFLYVRENMVSKVHWLRWLSLLGILAVFFGGGVLVSLKIGGGGDLHNLDAFLVFFLLITLSLLSGRMFLDNDATLSNKIELQRIPAILLMFVCLVPVWFAFMRSGTWLVQRNPDEKVKLQQIQQAFDIINETPGPILLVTERQLVTIGAVHGVEMLPEYEKVFLMEMAMGNNQKYLQEFYTVLDEHHYRAILMEPISTNIQLSWKSFAEENNSYVRNVILPMLMDYQLALSWDDGGINLMIPNGEPELMDRLQKIQTP